MEAPVQQGPILTQLMPPGVYQGAVFQVLIRTPFHWIDGEQHTLNGHPAGIGKSRMPQVLCADLGFVVV